MQIPDDDRQFEAELRRFAPRAAEPLPPIRIIRVRWRVPVAVAATVLAAIGTILWHMHGTPGPGTVLPADVSAGEVTLGRAQAAVAQSPSFEAAIDGLEQASRSRTKPKTHKNQSALQALGREEL
ncbi:MAG TPA: hypothetical protein VFK06_25425 [Candidatus Angelobacter sp.]|nr:hypothetical protein [Candidatus Angelobacter sp.]